MIPVRNTSLFARHTDVKEVRNGRDRKRSGAVITLCFISHKVPRDATIKGRNFVSREEIAAARFTFHSDSFMEDLTYDEKK